MIDTEFIADPQTKYNNKYNTFTVDERKFPGWDMFKMAETYRIAEEIFSQLTDEAVVEIFNATDELGLSELFDLICEEVYRVVYGQGMYGDGKAIITDTFGYLEKLTASVDETMRKENLLYFITSAIPAFELGWHHMQWAEICQRIKQYAILASRDHGKSFFFSNALAAWYLYRYSGKIPGLGRNHWRNNQRGFLFSFSISQAIDLLTILKDTIEESDILRERLYNKNKWNNTDITCANKARLTVKGFGSSVRGAHPGWIIVDDGLKDNVLSSKEQRNKGISYFHAVIMNMITPGGPVGVVGTPFHQMDLYGDLKTKKGWRVFEFPGIYPDGSVLWKGRWTFDGLMEKKESQGNLIFSREILCKPITNESSIFPIEILNNALYRMEGYTMVSNRASFPVKFQRVVAACDFSISGNVGADWCVFGVFGIDDRERMWLLNMNRFKGLSYHEQMAAIKKMNSDFNPDLIVMEDNVFQQIYVDESQRQGLPVIGNTTTSTKNDLREGWPGLAIDFERGMFLIPWGDQRSEDLKDLTISEFGSITFTDRGLQSTSEHDDIVSMFYHAKCAKKLLLTGSMSFGFDFV